MALVRTTALWVTFLWICLTTSLSLAQQNPNGVLPLNTTNEPYLFLVRDPEVHKDLELSSDQEAKLTKLNDRVDAIMWSMRNKPKEINALMRKATSETKAELQQILSREQVRRITQIELWVLGMKSLMRDSLAKHLQLESQQREQVREIIVAAEKGMADLRRQLNDGGDATELNRQFREIQVNQQKDIIAILTDEQRRKWVATLGKQIDTSKLGRIKFKAPEIDSSSGWVNSDPLSMEQLKGKVVALHFYAFH